MGAKRVIARTRRGRRRRTGRRRGLWVLAGILLLAVGVAAVWMVWPVWSFSQRLAERSAKQPSRLYGRPAHLVVDGALDRAALVAELQAMGYRRSAGRAPQSGEYVDSSGGLRVNLRRFPTAWGWNSGGLLETAWRGGRLRELRWRGRAVEQITLEPPLLYSYYGADRQDRRPVRLDELPRDLIQAVLAAEDARFFQHQGLSLRGIARSAWVNLRGGGIRQGGSTLTQQLVKNLLLSDERSLARKVREALLAVFIDWRYDKESILGAYLNEIYWGSSRGINLMGVGAAAWAYFGQDAERLSLCESAVLAGMIASPGSFSPVTRPDQSRDRRDWVLQRMAELGWLEGAELERALAEPLCAAPRPASEQRAPYFGDRMAAEAARRFGVRELRDTGYVLLSTLDRREQAAAEAAIAWGLEGLERGWERDSSARGPLQAALVSLDPRTGALAAYVGGRDYAASQFDRVSQARRQAGSAFKPVVYAAAFEDRTASPSTPLEDAPLTVALAGRDWRPQNSDDRFRGRVTVRTALEESLNVPTVRLALQVGLPRVVEIAEAMGIESELQPVPALALGAFEVTPLELAGVYAVLASGGVRRPTYGLRAVIDPRGELLEGEAPPPAVRVLSPQAVFLLDSVLQGVLDRGTATAVRAQGLTDPLAGKTGTTNQRRDSWFAGYSPDRVSLVWVGYDDNSPTRLSGARAALPIWARFTWSVRPAGGYPVIAQPHGIATAVVDPTSGQLATDECETVLTEVFLAGTVPTEICRLHGRWPLDEGWSAERWRVDERRGPLRWLRRLFRRDPPRPESPPPG